MAPSPATAPDSHAIAAPSAWMLVEGYRRVRRAHPWRPLPEAPCPRRRIASAAARWRRLADPHECWVGLSAPQRVPSTCGAILSKVSRSVILRLVSLLGTPTHSATKSRGSLGANCRRTQSCASGRIASFRPSRLTGPPLGSERPNGHRLDFRGCRMCLRVAHRFRWRIERWRYGWRSTGSGASAGW